MKTNYQTLLAKEDVNPVLHKWRGGLAKLWSYTVSHKVLEIRVMDEQDSERYLIILCGDVENIQGPTVWFHCDLEAEKVGTEFALHDKIAGFEVRAGVIGVEESPTM